MADPESHADTCDKAAGWEAAGFSGKDGRQHAKKIPSALRPPKTLAKTTASPPACLRLCTRELPTAQQTGLAAPTLPACVRRGPRITFPQVSAGSNNITCKHVSRCCGKTTEESLRKKILKATSAFWIVIRKQ